MSAVADGNPNIGVLPTSIGHSSGQKAPALRCKAVADTHARAYHQVIIHRQKVSDHIGTASPPGSVAAVESSTHGIHFQTFDGPTTNPSGAGDLLIRRTSVDHPTGTTKTKDTRSGTPCQPLRLAAGLGKVGFVGQAPMRLLQSLGRARCSTGVQPCTFSGYPRGQTGPDRTQGDGGRHTNSAPAPTGGNRTSPSAVSRPMPLPGTPPPSRPQSRPIHPRRRTRRGRKQVDQEEPSQDRRRRTATTRRLRRAKPRPMTTDPSPNSVGRRPSGGSIIQHSSLVVAAAVVGLSWLLLIVVVWWWV